MKARPLKHSSYANVPAARPLKSVRCMLPITVCMCADHNRRHEFICLRCIQRLPFCELSKTGWWCKVQKNRQIIQHNKRSGHQKHEIWGSLSILNQYIKSADPIQHPSIPSINLNHRSSDHLLSCFWKNYEAIPSQLRDVISSGWQKSALETWQLDMPKTPLQGCPKHLNWLLSKCRRRNVSLGPS